MTDLTILEKLDRCIDDPMWADHAEVPKSWLREWRLALASPPPVSLEEIVEVLRQSLRQWKMYAEFEADRDLSTEQTPEAEMYRSIISRLEQTTA